LGSDFFSSLGLVAVTLISGFFSPGCFFSSLGLTLPSSLIFEAAGFFFSSSAGFFSLGFSTTF
jgi:hypothetical protein